MNNEQTTPARDFQTCDGCKNDLVCHDQGECFNSTTDYGEPWDNELGDFEIYPRTGGEAIAYAEGSTIRDRIIAGINACAGMADPAAELAAMREAIREAYDAIKASPYPDQQALTKLQPFLK